MSFVELLESLGSSSRDRNTFADEPQFSIPVQPLRRLLDLGFQETRKAMELPGFGFVRWFGRAVDEGAVSVIGKLKLDNDRQELWDCTLFFEKR